jgi:hypothetical protein
MRHCPHVADPETERHGTAAPRDHEWAEPVSQALGPPSGDHTTRPQRHWFGSWCRFCTLVFVVGLSLGAVAQTGLPGMVALGMMLGALVLSVGPLIIWAGWRIGASIGDEIKLASTPIPSPIPIEAQLTAAWGRPPTVVEVAAVHQMLASRHQQALLNGVIGLGLLYEIDKHV